MDGGAAQLKIFQFLVSPRHLMPYRKTAPLPVELVKTKRGIVFSFHLSQPQEPVTQPATPTTVPTSPASSASFLEAAVFEGAENIQDTNEVKRRFGQDTEGAGQGPDPKVLQEKMTALEEMNQDGLDANPSQGSPTNSLSSQRSKRSRTESSADLTEAIQDSSSVTSTSAKIPGLGGYALGVSVHKVTSTRLLSRFHKNSQESKDFAAILHPSLLPPAKETTTAGSGADKNAHNHVGAYRKKKPTHTAGAGECNWCGTRKTAQWRKGPTGPRGLCNVSVRILQ